MCVSVSWRMCDRGDDQRGASAEMSKISADTPSIYVQKEFKFGTEDKNWW